MEWAPFLKRYGIGLLIETVLGGLEWFVNIMPWPFWFQAAVLSSIAALWVLWETWRETPFHRRPDWSAAVLFWGVGTLWLWGSFSAVSRIVPQPVTVQLSPLPAEKIVVPSTPSPSPTLPYGYAKVCADAPPSPFSVGMWGYICNEDKIILREKASPRARDLAHMEPGTKFVIIGGPECGDRRVWWQMRFQGNDQPYNNGWVGWMPESDPGGSELYLCPLP